MQEITNLKDEEREYYINEDGVTCFDENGYTYAEDPDDGCFYPNIGIIEDDGEPTRNLSKWGGMRFNYIRDHKKALYSQLTMALGLHKHCLEVEDEALELHDRLMTERMRPYEHLKTDDYWDYLQTLNNVLNQVDEIVASELIYV